MNSISRRGFVISAAAAGAAFGLDGPLEFFTPAFAQKATQDVVKFKVGDIEVIQMYDGTWEKAHDPGFVKNASLDEVKAALKAGGLTDAHVPIPFTVTAIKSKGKMVLFDSGTGAQVAPTAGLITKNEVLKAAGIDPAKVDDHRHDAFPRRPHQRPDGEGHQRGELPERDDLRAAATEYKFWTDPATTAGAAKRIQTVFPTWKNIKQFDGDKDVVAGVRADQHQRPYAGPHQLPVSSGRNQLIVLGDVSNIPALFVRNPGWHAAFDVARQLRPREPAQDLTIASSPTWTTSPATISACRARARSPRTARATCSRP